MLSAVCFMATLHPHSSFPAWSGYMMAGFSLLLYGLGDKSAVAEAFVSRVSAACHCDSTMLG
jgi:hypothetical protein